MAFTSESIIFADSGISKLEEVFLNYELISFFLSLTTKYSYEIFFF